MSFTIRNGGNAVIKDDIESCPKGLYGYSYANLELIYAFSQGVILSGGAR